MSQENVSSIFKNLDISIPGITDLVKTIKTFLNDNLFQNSRNAKEYVQPENEDDEVAVFTDDEGIEWAGPDFRNAILTPYVSPHEEAVDIFTVAVGLVFSDATLKKATGVLITIDEYEEYYFSGECTWIDVRERILCLIGGEACIGDYNGVPKANVVVAESNELPEVKVATNDPNETPRKRKVVFLDKVFVRTFSDSPEDLSIDCEGQLKTAEKAMDPVRAKKIAEKQADKLLAKKVAEEQAAAKRQRV
jgi:hypothetical protein